MTGFDPDTLTLGDERDRLSGRLDDLVSQLADADDGTAGAAMLAREARDVDQAGQAVAALVEEYGADATVTVRGLNAGAYARVEDRTADMAAEKRGQGGTPGASRNVYAAAGLVDAPFMHSREEFEADHETGGQDWDDYKISAVAGQSVGVAKWLESLVDERTRNDEGNWKPLAERLAGTGGD